MLWRLVVGLVIAGSLGSMTRADDSHPLPLLAANPEPPPSPWTGLFVGTEVVGAAAKGSKGFVGGDAFAGYNRVFDNHVIVGIDAASGYAPGFFGLGPIVGYDFSAANVRLGYEVGRFTPYVTTGLVLAKPATGLGSTLLSPDYPNAIFASPGHVDAAARVGAGFTYALTSTTSVGLGLSYGRGAAAVLP